jgi:hypothetical protein
MSRLSRVSRLSRARTALLAIANAPARDNVTPFPAGAGAGIRRWPMARREHRPKSSVRPWRRTSVQLAGGRPPAGAQAASASRTSACREMGPRVPPVCAAGAVHGHATCYRAQLRFHAWNSCYANFRTDKEFAEARNC